MENILLRLGIILFLIGLLTGFVVPKMANPRMGVASHLQGVLNGMFLAALGLLWQRLDLPAIWLALVFWLAIYGTFANWLATLLAAVWGAGAIMTVAGMGRQGSSRQELAINFLLYTVSVVMVAVCVIVIVGLGSG